MRYFYLFLRDSILQGNLGTALFYLKMPIFHCLQTRLIPVCHSLTNITTHYTFDDLKKITGHKLGYTVQNLVLHRMFHKLRSVELSFWNYVFIFLCGDRNARLRRGPLSEP
jgi:hypothetical protein